MSRPLKTKNMLKRQPPGLVCLTGYKKPSHTSVIISSVVDPDPDMRKEKHCQLALLPIKVKIFG
jgi:hypothetical protein